MTDQTLDVPTASPIRTPRTLLELEGRIVALEAATLREALRESGWVVARAARRLGAVETSLRRMLERHPGIAAEVTRRREGRARA